MRHPFSMWHPFVRSYKHTYLNILKRWMLLIRFCLQSSFSLVRQATFCHTSCSQILSSSRVLLGKQPLVTLVTAKFGLFDKNCYFQKTIEWFERGFGFDRVPSMKNCLARENHLLQFDVKMAKRFKTWNWNFSSFYLDEIDELVVFNLILCFTPEHGLVAPVASWRWSLACLRLSNDLSSWTRCHHANKVKSLTLAVRLLRHYIWLQYFKAQVISPRYNVGMMIIVKPEMDDVQK